MSSIEYESIFLHKDWTLTKYQGWKLLADDAHARLLVKAVGPFRRYLVLRYGCPDKLQSWMHQYKLVSEFSEVVDHDFTHNSKETEKHFNGMKWNLVTGSRRILNIGTFVIDLNKSEEELWDRLGSKSRNMVRKALESEIEINILDKESPMVDLALNQFITWYATMAERNQLIPPSLAMLKKMIDDGRANAVVAVAKDKAILAVNIIYMAGVAGFYLYGASANNIPTGLGQAIHWKTSLYLKNRALCWYDLGGVPENNPESGIFKFKKSLGGEPVELGSEYSTSGRIFKMFSFLRRLIK